MGLGIHKDSSMTVYTIPLMGYADEKWEDNTWIIEHLHQLARKIKESRMKIISVGTITTNATGALPELVVKGYENYVEARVEGKPTPLRAVDFDKMSSRQKWDLWEELIDVKWVCNACHCAHETDGKMGFWDGTKPFRAGMDTIQCGECGNVLTHRTNGGQSNPFEWTFVTQK